MHDFWLEPKGQEGRPAHALISQNQQQCKEQSPREPFPANETGCVYTDAALTQQITRAVLDRDRSKPLLMYWASRIVHGALQVPQAYFDRWAGIPDGPRRTYTAMVSYIDEAIGNVTRLFKEQGMWNDTVFILQSDNGGPGNANNYP